MRIFVEDNGDGIPPEELSRVFDPYHQAHAANGNGLGLGLAICKEIAAAHGGAVTLHSDGKDCGTVAMMELPSEAVKNSEKSGGSQ